MNQIKKIQDTSFEGKPFITWVRSISEDGSQTIITVYVLLEIPMNYNFTEPKKIGNDYHIELISEESTQLGIAHFVIDTFVNEITEEFSVKVFKNDAFHQKVTMGQIGIQDPKSIVLPKYLAAPFVFPEFDKNRNFEKVIRIHCAVLIPEESTIHLIKDTENLKFNYSIEGEFPTPVEDIYYLHCDTFSIAPESTIEQASFSVSSKKKRKKVLVSTKDGTVNQDN